MGRLAIVFLCSLGLTLLAYFRTLNGWFLSDDADIGRIIPDGSSVDWRHVARTFASDWRGYEHAEFMYYRPLVIVSYALNGWLFELNSWGFHLTNLLVHALNGFLVYALAERLFASKLSAAFAAGLFLLHPWHPEAVLWISGRSDLLYAAAALGALNAHLCFRQEGRDRQLWVMGLFYVVGLLAKDTAIAVPLMVVALDAVRPGYARQNNALRWALPWLVTISISMLYLAWRAKALGDIWSGRRHHLTAWSADTCDGWMRNFELFFLPFNRVQAGPDPAPFYAGGALALGLIACVAIVRAASGRLPWRPVLACAACFVAAVAPFAATMGLMWDLRGARLLYLPSALLAILVALSVGGSSLPDNARTRRWTGGLSVAAAAGMIGHFGAVLLYNQIPWIQAGETIVRLRDGYASIFGRYDGEPIEDLPGYDRGAYLALYNAAVFSPPFVTAPPRPDQQVRLRMTYDLEARVGRVFVDPAFAAAERLERDQKSGVWLWEVEGAPLRDAELSNCRPAASSAGVGFVATSADPWLIVPLSRALAPPESRALAETVYLWISPKPSQLPELFWVNSGRQVFSPRRQVALRPELYMTPGGIAQREADGFFLYAARLDEHAKWPGIHRVHAVRLDPTGQAGPFAIKYFNIARELRGAR